MSDYAGTAEAPPQEPQKHESGSDGFTLDSVLIRYEGLDADRHIIDMVALGESMQGLGKIYGMAGHFVATGHYAKQSQALTVKAYAKEPKAKCFQLAFDLQTVLQSQIFSGMAGSILTAVVAYAIARHSNKGEEMKHLRELLEKQMDEQSGRNAELTTRLLGTIEKLVDGMGPAIKQAVAPIGNSCRHIDLFGASQQGERISIDQSVKDAIMKPDPETELTPEQVFTLVLTELDREKGTAKVRLLDGFTSDGDDSERIAVKIIDPAFDMASNAYIAHFSSGEPLKAKGKASLKDGVIKTIYLSDTVV